MLTNHRKWLSLLRGSLPQLTRVLAGMLLVAILQLPAPLITMRILNQVSAPQSRVDTIPLLVGLLVLLFFAKLIVNGGQRFALDRFRIDVTGILKKALVERVFRLPLSYFLVHAHGELLARLEEDPHRLDQFLSDILLTSISDVLTLSFGIAVLFYLNWKLALFAVISIPISAAFVFKLRTSLKQMVGELQNRETRLSALLAESLQNIFSIKTLGLEPWTDDRFDAGVSHIRKQRLGILKLRVTYESLVSSCSGLAGIFVLAYAAFGIAHRTITVGEFVAFTGYLAYLYHPADSLVISVLNAQGALQAADRIGDLLDKKTEEMLFLPVPLTKQDNVQVSIRFDQVYFRYSESGDWVLRDISCEFRAGSITAIAGPSGCGKTSMVNLIPQLIRPSAGSIEVLGFKYDSLAELRNQISIVSQDSFLFAGNLHENLVLGNDRIPKSKIQGAVRIACVDDFCCNPELLSDFLISEGGRSLSAGQRQRVLIARAVLRQPKILILDEATSCLDAETECRVVTNIRQMNIPIVIIVSHREGIRNMADDVVRISNGQILGTPIVGVKQIAFRSGDYSEKAN